MSRPLPEPELFYWKPSFVKGESVQILGYTAEAMHTHAAAVLADGVAALTAERDQLRDYLRIAQIRASSYAEERDRLREDAERWRAFLATRPANTHEVITAAIDAAREPKP